MVNRIVLPVMMVVVPLPVSTDELSPTIPCLHVADWVDVEPLNTEPTVVLGQEQCLQWRSGRSDPAAV